MRKLEIIYMPLYLFLVIPFALMAASEWIGLFLLAVGLWYIRTYQIMWTMPDLYDGEYHIIESLIKCVGTKSDGKMISRNKIWIDGHLIFED